jgi:hypothetical protein
MNIGKEKTYRCILRHFLELGDIINNKKLEYKMLKLDVTLNCKPDENNKFVFIGGENEEFKRMIMILINNAREAI